MKTILLKLIREALLIVAGFVLVILVFFALSQLPYKYTKYDPFYYLNNVLFIEPLPENPLLVETAFGKIGIRYREDIVKGMLFFGELHHDSDETEIGERVEITNMIDIHTFREIQKNNGSSVSTYYRDKKFSYVVVDMSDGAYLHIYENK